MAWKKFLWQVFQIFLPPMSGVFISVSLDDWTWFARSGAMMVAISILTFGQSYAKAMQAELLNSIRNILKNKNEEIRELITIDHVWHSSTESNLHYGLGVIGGFFGTLVWEFGDLIG